MIKKVFLYAVMAIIPLISCKTTEASRAQSTKGTTDQQKMINGPWILDTVTYEGNEGKFSSVLFNDADATCSATWRWAFRSDLY